MNEVEAGRAEESILLPYMGEMKKIFEQPEPDVDAAVAFTEKIEQKIDDSKIVPKSKLKMKSFLEDFREAVREGTEPRWPFKFMKWFTDAILRKGDLGVLFSNDSLEGDQMVLTEEGKQKVAQELLFIADFLQEVRTASQETVRASVADELEAVADLLDKSNPRKNAMKSKVAEELDAIAKILQEALQK